MEPPLKRHQPTFDDEEDLKNRKIQNDLRLRSTLEAIFEKYSKDFSQVGDEIDLETGKIVVNNGHLLSMRDEQDEDGHGNLTDELYGTDSNGSEDDGDGYLQESHLLSMRDEQNEDDDGKATDELYGSGSSGREDDGSGYSGNPIIHKKSIPNATAPLSPNLIARPFKNHVFDTEEHLDVHGIVASTLPQEHDQNRDLRSLDGSTGKHSGSDHLAGDYNHSKFDMGRRTGGTGDCTLSVYGEDRQANLLQHLDQEMLMSEDNDSLMGDIRETETVVEKETSSETKPTSLPSPPSARDAYEKLSKVFTDSSKRENRDPVWWYKQLAIALQLLAPDSLRSNAMNNGCGESSETSDQCLPRDSSLESPRVRKRTKDLVKPYKTKAEKPQRSIYPWSKEDNELLIHLRATTDLTFKQMTAKFPGRPMPCISAHWSWLVKKARNNKSSPYLKAAILNAQARQMAFSPEPENPNANWTERIESSPMATSPPGSRHIIGKRSTIHQATQPWKDAATNAWNASYFPEGMELSSENPLSPSERSSLPSGIPSAQMRSRPISVVIERLVPSITSAGGLSTKSSALSPTHLQTPPTSSFDDLPNHVPNPDWGSYASRSVTETVFAGASSDSFPKIYQAPEASLHSRYRTPLSQDLNLEKASQPSKESVISNTYHPESVLLSTINKATTVANKISNSRPLLDTLERPTQKLPLSTPTFHKSVDSHRRSLASVRRNIILDIIKNCGGVFPGEEELWYPFNTAWLERSIGEQQDLKTLKIAIGNLVDSGKLRKLAFGYHNKKGVALIGHILTLGSVTPSNPKVRDMQRKISACDPRLYVPQQVKVLRSLEKQGELVRRCVHGLEVEQDEGDGEESSAFSATAEGPYTDARTGSKSIGPSIKVVSAVVDARSRDWMEMEAHEPRSTNKSALKRSTPLSNAIELMSTSSPSSGREVSVVSTHVASTDPQDGEQNGREILTPWSTPDHSPLRKTKYTAKVTPLQKCSEIRSRSLLSVNRDSPKSHQTIAKSPLKMDTCLSGVSKSSKKRQLSASVLDASGDISNHVAANEETVMEDDQTALRSGLLRAMQDFALEEDLRALPSQDRIDPTSTVSMNTSSLTRPSKKLKPNPTELTRKSRSVYSSNLQKKSKTVLPDSGAERSIWEIVDSESEADSSPNLRAPVSQVPSPLRILSTPNREDIAPATSQNFEDLPIRSAKSLKQAKVQPNSRLSTTLKTSYGDVSDLSDDELSLPTSTVKTPASKTTSKVKKRQSSHQFTKHSSSSSLWS